MISGADGVLKVDRKNFPCRIEYENESTLCVPGDFDRKISVPL